MEERLRHALQFVDSHVHFGETKNAAVFIAAGGGAVAVATILLGEDGIPRLLRWYLVLGGGLFIAAAVISTVSFLPRTHLPWLSELARPEETDNLLFFGHAQKYSPEGYWRALAGASVADSPSRIELCLSEQIVINARIAARKFTLFGYAAWVFVAAIITPLGAWLLSMYISDPNG